MPLKDEVKLFLQELKSTIKIWEQNIIFEERKKNSLQDLADLGINAKRRLEIIGDLRLEDYYKGPTPDTQFNGEALWEFGKIIDNTEIYIKLTLIRNSSVFICISFHKAERILNYPLK